MNPEEIYEQDWKEAEKIYGKLKGGTGLAYSPELFALCLIYVGNVRFRLLQKKHHDLEHDFQDKMVKK